MTSRGRLPGCFVGLCTVDLSYVVSDFPLPNQKVSASRQELAAGGPATNAAITFAFLGGAASLVTGLGVHALAAVAREDLERQEIELHDLAEDPSAPPTLSSICVHEATGDRTIVSANAKALSASVDKFDPRVLSGAKILLVDGHHMQACIAAAKAARDAGITVVLDGGSWKERMEGLLPFVDIAICSEDFTAPVDLHNLGVSKIAITRGPKSILWSTADSNGDLPVRAINPKTPPEPATSFTGPSAGPMLQDPNSPRLSNSHLASPRNRVFTTEPDRGCLRVGCNRKTSFFRALEKFVPIE